MYYFPIMTMTPTYFDKHRGFAVGFVLSGSGVGGVVMALVLQTLLNGYGVHWALRILGVWNLVVGIPVACVVRHRPGFAVGTRTTVSMTVVNRGTFLYQVRDYASSHAVRPIRLIFSGIWGFLTSCGKRRSHILPDILFSFCLVVFSINGKHSFSSLLWSE